MKEPKGLPFDPTNPLGGEGPGGGGFSGSIIPCGEGDGFGGGVPG